MPTDLLLRDAMMLWNRGRYYQAIVLHGAGQPQREPLPLIDGVVLEEIQSAAAIEAAWLEHLLSGAGDYQDEEVDLILTKRQNLATVAAVLRRLGFTLKISLDEIDYAIRNRFAARSMPSDSRRIYHDLYLTRGTER